MVEWPSFMGRQPGNSKGFLIDENLLSPRSIPRSGGAGQMIEETLFSIVNLDRSILTIIVGSICRRVALRLDLIRWFLDTQLIKLLKGLVKVEFVIELQASLGFGELSGFVLSTLRPASGVGLSVPIHPLTRELPEVTNRS